MSDIVERLRQQGDWTADKVWESNPNCVEAADTIEALRAENARLKAANADERIHFDTLYADYNRLRDALKRLHDAAGDIGDDEMSYSIREWWFNELSHARKVLEYGDD